MTPEVIRTKVGQTYWVRGRQYTVLAIEQEPPERPHHYHTVVRCRVGHSHGFARTNETVGLNVFDDMLRFG